MKRHTTILTLALVAGLGFCVPASAAAGPLLSGYGGPGSGSQVIVGAALLGGGGSGGSSQGGSGAGSTGGPANGSPSGVTGASAGGGGNGTRGSGAAGTGSRQGERSPGEASVGGSATHHGAAGATSQTSNLQAGQAAEASSPAWFSGADLLALVLAAGVLVLVGLATLRVSRAQHH